METNITFQRAYLTVMYYCSKNNNMPNKVYRAAYRCLDQSRPVGRWYQRLLQATTWKRR